jgi:F5/8 type C domain/Trehalase
MNISTLLSVGIIAGVVSLCSTRAAAEVLDKQKQLDAQTFWDNRDWDWYRANIPFFECPDAEITTTYYYRWELVTKHLTYGSPNSGYSFTEFIDRPFWSGAYGAISCPAGHQLYEARWLREPRIARDYLRYWFRTPGAQPRRYSTWLADAAWAFQLVHPDDAFVKDLLPDLIKNYAGWEQRHFVPEIGLFWQIGHDDGMEYNITSRQTKDILRGGPGFRPSFNAYMWADAQAIARIADLAGDRKTAEQFREKADGLKRQLQARLWDERREFFFPLSRDDEEHDGHKVNALTLTYQSGQFAGDPHGRELIGYVPWQFGMPDRGRGYERAWRSLMDRERFFAAFGPTTVERHDPLFVLKKTCCWWSGQSWPYATTQTLKALANVLQDYDQTFVTKADYLKLLHTFAVSHRKDGKPYLAEALHPDTGSFEGHDSYNHSEHYFHSGFCDLVITGLVGLKPRDNDILEIQPLAPDDWDFFALDDVAYRGRRIGIVWDKLGTRYGLGKGLHILIDGKLAATSVRLERLIAPLPKLESPPAESRPRLTAVNFAVNNDGDYYPRITASYTGANSSPAKVIDGNYWYHVHPPNRWTAEGSPNGSDWLTIDFGVKRTIHTAKLYLLDDGEKIVAPRAINLEYWTGDVWKAVPGQVRAPEKPTGHRANVIRFSEIETTKLRATLHHAAGAKSGLTEFEAWGDATLPIAPAPPPIDNLAYNPGNLDFPKASASFTSRFDKAAEANDGRIVFAPEPRNRWTSYESPHDRDWLEIDFGRQRSFSRIELAIFDDRGGVQAPRDYVVQYAVGDEWKDAVKQMKSPEKPTGGVINTVTFEQIAAAKVRVVFLHNGPARSGVSEILIWRE